MVAGFLPKELISDIPDVAIKWLETLQVTETLNVYCVHAADEWNRINLFAVNPGLVNFLKVSIFL